MLKQIKFKKMKIETTSVTQTGNETLGTKEKKLYYLIISNEAGEKLVVNVGEKTHDSVKKLQENDDKLEQELTKTVTESIEENKKTKK